MNANPKFLAATAHVDDAAIAAAQLAQGLCRCAQGADARSQPRDTPSMFGGEKNLLIYVTTVLALHRSCREDETRKGLPALRERRILNDRILNFFKGRARHWA
jgi:phosphomethylpyrimidine synthase